MLYDLVSSEKLDGLVIWGAVGALIAREEIQAFCHRYDALPAVSGLPLVSIALRLDNIPSVLADNYGGMRQAIVHLIEDHDCCRIAYVKGMEHFNEHEERYRAYLEVLDEYGISFDPNLVVSRGDTHEDLDRPSGDMAVRILLDQRKAKFDALVINNDPQALSALKALQARRLYVPEDILIASFDNAEEARCSTPPITTVPFPAYELGWQAVEVLLKQLQGQDVPEQVIVPTNLIIRQSCGCLNPAVVQAGLCPVTTVKTEESFEIMLACQRETLIREIAQLIGISEDSLEWIRDLLDGFVGGIQEQSPGIFLQTLNKVLAQMIATNGDMDRWHAVLSTLRRKVQPYMTDSTMVARAENLWQQARTMIGETIKRVQAYQHVQSKQQTQTLRRIEETLLTSFDIKELLSVLTRELPNLDIPGYYLSRYENPDAPAEWSQLMLAYNDENGMADLGSHGQRFPSLQLVPTALLSENRQYSFVVEPLFFQEKQLGFVLFDSTPAQGDVFEVLRGQISNALQGAQLVKAVQKHASELAIAYEEIQILNNQLKEENLRMGAELDVSRRIQQMVLPSSEELQQISGVDIVGYMQPADEVGGDYYDVLQNCKKLLIGIGDVTGHGLESGVLMLMTQATIRTLIEHGETDLKAILSTLNRVILKNARRMGVDKTLAFALVNYQDKQVKIVGQHEEVLVVRKGGQVERIDTVNLGFPIGLEEEIADWVAEASVVLNSGDGIVLYTDGITEAEDEAGKQYGIERFCETVSRNWPHSVQEIRHAVIQDVVRHTRKHKLYDDLTLVVLKQQ